MGANVSTNVVDEISESITDITSNILSNYSNNSSSTNTINQTMNLAFEGNVECDNLDLSQIASSTQNVLAQISNENNTKITDAISNSILQKIQDLVSQKNSGINFGQTNIANNFNTSKSKIKNVIDESVSSTISNNLNVSNNINQGKVLTIGGNLIGKNCNFSQNAILKTLSSQIATNVVKSVLDNTASNVVTQDTKNQTDQSNEGLSLFGFLLPLIIFCGIAGLIYFKGMSFVREHIVPISAILIFILIIGIVFFTIKKAYTADIISGVVLVILCIILAYIYFTKPKVNLNLPIKK